MKTIDTTGAGDAFLGAVLYRLQQKKISEIRNISKGELENIIDFANAAGSLTTTKNGAITAVPGLEEVRACQNNVKLLAD